jgi:hypothetical protein
VAADDELKGEMAQLEKLDPAARSRVQSALKDALERETLAGQAGGGAAAAGNIFSRGWIFSRLTPTAIDLAGIRELPGVAGLSAQEFTDFAGRLAELKRKTDVAR